MPERTSDSSKPPTTGTGPAPKISRRKFGGRAAAAAALSLSPSAILAPSGLLAPSSLLAAHGVSAPEGSGQAETRPEDLAKLGITPEQAREVEAKLSNIIRKYGDRLSGAQREHLRRILAYNERMLAGVRAFAVQNGDPPASVLRVSFANEKTPAEQSAGRTISKPQRVIPRPKR